VRKNISDYGASAALLDLRYRVLNRIVPFRELRGMTAVADDIDANLLEIGAYQARFASRDELLAATSHPDHAGEMTADFVADALAKGDQCFGIFDGDLLASYGWYSRQPTHIRDGVYLMFDPEWAYMYKGYTVPARRGQRLYGLGMSLALRAFTESRARGLISYVEANNFPALRATERMGYRCFGTVYLASLPGGVVSWATPGCKHYGFRAEFRPARAQNS
jgi:hypothetical protein